MTKSLKKTKIPDHFFFFYKNCHCNNFYANVIFNSSGKTFDWVCSTDKTDIYISNLANVRCDNEKPWGGWYHSGQLLKARWNCGRHENNGFEGGSAQGFTYTLQEAALEFNMSRWGRKFTLDLLDSIAKQYG